MNKTLSVLCGTMMLFSLSARGSLIDITTEFHVFVAEDFRGIHSDAAGRVAAGGNVEILDGYSIGGTSTVPGQYSLISGGDVLLQRGTISNGGIYADGSVTNSTCEIYGNVVAGSYIGEQHQIKNGQFIHNEGYTNPVNFAGIHSELTAISQEMASMEATGNVSVQNGNITLTGNNVSGAFTVFELSGTDLANSYQLTLNNMAEDEIAIINVSGVYNSVGYGGFDRISVPEIALFNFYEAETISIHGSFTGSILAPFASVTGENGHMYGGLYAESFSGNTEFHLHIFDHDIPRVPEASTVSYLIIGMLGMATAVRGRFKR